MYPAWPGFSFTSCPAGTITARTSRFTTKGSFSCLRIELLGGDRRRARDECGVQGVPAEARALHPRGELAHPGKRGELAERGIGRAVGLREEHVHPLEQLPYARAVLTLDGFGHERGRRRGDRAAASLEADVLDPVTLQPQGEREAVAAQRVVPLGAVARTLEW